MDNNTLISKKTSAVYHPAESHNPTTKRLASSSEHNVGIQVDKATPQLRPKNELNMGLVASFDLGKMNSIDKKLDKYFSQQRDQNISYRNNKLSPLASLNFEGEKRPKIPQIL